MSNWDQSDNIWQYRDNVKIACGNSSDLQIYHTGSYSVIQNNTGGLFVQGENAVTIKANNNVEILKATGDENMAKFIPDGAVELYYNNTKRLETASYGASITGNLGVNTTSPTVGYGGDVGLHIHSSATSGTRGSSIHLTSGTSGTTAADGSRINTSDNDLVIQNMENGRLDLGTNGAHRITIKGDGDVGINNDNPATKLDVTGNIRASTGILFGSDTGSGNTLHDYEEGTFTPQIRANANTNGAVNGTGSYVKVGKTVTIHVNIGNKTLTGFPQSGPGAIRIDGLPFTANHAVGDEFGVSSKCIIMGVDNQSNNIYFRTDPNQTYLYGYYNANGSTWVYHDAGFWDNSGVYCIFNMTYFTNS